MYTYKFDSWQIEGTIEIDSNVLRIQRPREPKRAEDVSSVTIPLRHITSVSRFRGIVDIVTKDGTKRTFPMTYGDYGAEKTAQAFVDELTSLLP